MKRYILSYLGAIILLSLPAATVCAYVQMPVGNPLQPIPHAAHAHVSGNVNATTITSSSAVTATSAPGAVLLEVQKEIPQENASPWGWYVVIAACVSLGIAGVWYFLFRLPE